MIDIFRCISFSFIRLFSKIGFVISLYLLTGLNLSHAQNFKRFSNRQGLNHNTINVIEQDRYGFLWYGTPNGIVRYDGYQFKTYTSQSNINGSLNGNYIHALSNDNKGMMWIGTNLGLNVYIPWLEKFYTVPLSNNISISHIDVDASGRVWFSGENQLYVCELLDLEKGTFKVSDNILESYSRLSSINSFVFKDDSTLILGTSLGLKQLSLKTINQPSALSNLEGLNNQQINSLAIIQNILWIGTSNGLYKATLEERLQIISAFNDSKEQPFPVIINTILEDHSGMVWVGTQDNGLYKYNQKEDTFEHFAHSKKNKRTISSKYINAIYEDDFNILWIGTAQGGINKLDLAQKSFITYEHDPYDNNSISDNLLTSILEDKKGRLWLSGYNSSLFRSTSSVNDMNVGKLEFEDLHAKLPMSDEDIIRCIYEAENGFIWFGLDSSVIIYNPLKKEFKKVIFKNNDKLFSAGPIWGIIQIDETRMLLGGFKILVVENPWKDFNNNSTLNIESIYDLQDGCLQTIIRDDKHSFWFGTTKGLMHGVFKENKIIIDQEYNTQSKNIRLSYNDVFSLHKEKNHLWVGTFGGGLNKMTLNGEGLPTKIEYFRKDDTLPGDVINGILSEGDSHLWLSTDMGLVKFNSNNNATNVYDIRDGLLQNNFRQNCFFEGKSGHFYFGGLNGLTVFKPESITLNTQVPEILITSLLIDNKPVKINEKIKNKVVLEKSISETESISLGQNQTIIAFNLAVKHTSVPSKNKIAYKLEGFNDNWIEEPTGKTTVTYTNLSAGDYTFRIKAANSDGVWSKTDKQLFIEILPRWYNTWWSYLLFFILTVSICVGVIFYFVQHEKLKQGLKYEKIDKERKEIVNQGKFRYFTNLSHEFRTPLTLISGPLERVINNNSDVNNVKYLRIIQKNTKRLLSLADQLITFRQAEQGHINLNLVKCTLGDFIYPTTEAFENYALEKNINFFYKITQPNEEVVIDIEKLERIIFNLLSNAFKNTPSEGNISIEAGITKVSGYEDKIINIDVVDTGKGIPKENLDNIFERFYQLGTKEGDISGGGIGLSFCKSIVNLLNGEISAQSNPGIETRFSVKIPSGDPEDYSLNSNGSTNKSYIKDWVPISNTVIALDTESKETNHKKNYTILVVENEQDVQHFLMTELSVKYNVIIANNGIEAFDKIKLKKPDLIISDVMMPEMDGYEFCEKIKSIPDTSHIPIILLTALGDNDNVIKGLEYGADDYISKPFSLKHLELRINKLIQINKQIKKYFSKNSLLPKENNDIKLSKKDQVFLENIVKILEKNLSNSAFGVEELSKEVGLSTSHFYKRFKQFTGQIPSVYIRHYRLERAAELLKSNEGFNVAEVMYQIGIESSSYFSASFKKRYGVSPSEFLKRK